VRKLIFSLREIYLGLWEATIRPYPVSHFRQAPCPTVTAAEVCDRPGQPACVSHRSTDEVTIEQCTNCHREAFCRTPLNKGHTASPGSTSVVMLHKFLGLFNDTSNIETIWSWGSTIHTILLFRITRVFWTTPAQMDHYQNDALPILLWRYETDIPTDFQADFKKKSRRRVSFVICNDTVQIAGSRVLIVRHTNFLSYYAEEIAKVSFKIVRFFS
jgi:hypothetical protein